MPHPFGADGMILFGAARKLFPLMVLAAALVAGPNRAAAVQVNSAAEGVQLKEGCAGESAEVCGLRMYQVMVESFVDGDPARNYNAGYGTSHHKGDIRGIINSLDYIQSTGMNAIWLTPVFDSVAGSVVRRGRAESEARCDRLLTRGTIFRSIRSSARLPMRRSW